MRKKLEYPSWGLKMCIVFFIYSRLILTRFQYFEHDFCYYVCDDAIRTNKQVFSHDGVSIFLD